MTALLLSMLIAAQPIPASPIEEARIVRHGPRPCCGSGYFHFTIAYEIEAKSGIRTLVYQSYFGAQDIIRPAGARCTIWFQPHDGRAIVHDPHGEETGAPHLLITRMACDSDLTGRPPPR